MPVKAPGDVCGAISLQQINDFQKNFEAQPIFRQAMNAVCVNKVSTVALDRRVAASINHSFSVQIPENPATSQKHSGRCWMFAALNTFRTKVATALNLEPGFELSQNYTMFWDKFEKANYFLENILITTDEPVGSRLLDWLLASPVQDGGQWDMFVNLVQKYGVVPKSVMPETYSSSNTGELNSFLTAKLREFACRLRDSASQKATPEDLQTHKSEFMNEIYRILCIHLGEPPTQFSFQWRDKDKEFHREDNLTPVKFYSKYVGINLDEYVCLIHDPRPNHPLNQVYTVKFLGNVVGGRPTEYLNTDIATIKKVAIEQLQKKEPVWFGCDVGKHLERGLGVMDLDIYDFEGVFGTSSRLSKSERLMYGHSQMTHAMVFTGVDLDSHNKPKKWRVENSWSDEPGDKGFFQMTDDWFNEYTYEVVVEKSLLSQTLLSALSTDPIALEPWDPMGSLA